MTLANLSAGPRRSPSDLDRRARVVVPSQASARFAASAASRPNLLLDTSNGGRVWTVTKLSVGAGPVIATSFAGRGGWLVSGAAFPGCPATLDATVDVGSRWSVLGSVPTVGEGAPSTPGYDIDSAQPRRRLAVVDKVRGCPRRAGSACAGDRSPEDGRPWVHLDQVLAAAIGRRHMACRSTVARGPWTCRDPVPPRSTCRRLDAGRRPTRPARPRRSNPRSGARPTEDNVGPR